VLLAREAGSTSLGRAVANRPPRGS